MELHGAPAADGLDLFGADAFDAEHRVEADGAEFLRGVVEEEEGLRFVGAQESVGVLAAFLVMGGAGHGGEGGLGGEARDVEDEGDGAVAEDGGSRVLGEALEVAAEGFDDDLLAIRN